MKQGAQQVRIRTAFVMSMNINQFVQYQHWLTCSHSTLKMDTEEWHFHIHLVNLIESVCRFLYYNDDVMGAMASQITSLTIVYSVVYSGENQRKHQSSASLSFVRGIHQWPVNSPHKEPVTWKCFHLITSSWIQLVLPRRQHGNLMSYFAVSFPPQMSGWILFRQHRMSGNLSNLIDQVTIKPDECLELEGNGYQTTHYYQPSQIVNTSRSYRTCVAAFGFRWHMPKVDVIERT